MKKDKVRRVDVLREVEAMHRRAAAVDASSVVGDMRWYGAALAKERRNTGIYSMVAGVMAVVLSLAMLPQLEYSYMTGAAADTPQEVCADIREVLGMV
jgi:hypothetical protein